MGPAKPKNKKSKKPSLPPGMLLRNATSKLQEGDFEGAALSAKRALAATGEGGNYELHALNLLGMISIETGEADAARAYLARAVALDENGTRDEKIGGGPDKFLWMAQLSEEGGHDSVAWFEKGAAALRRQIRAVDDSATAMTAKAAPNHSGFREAEAVSLGEKKHKLAGVLCAVAEVYMTDLSWEADAEARCEALITEATLTAPDCADTWQTVANVRISQERVDEARAALDRSLGLWRDLPPEDPRVPEFPTRVGLARLLLEVGRGVQALEVLERLVEDDDESVEVWYLGGWALYLEGRRIREAAENEARNGAAKGKAMATETDEDDGAWRLHWITARRWLAHCLGLYAMQEYEDERLGGHARELLEQVCAEVGAVPEAEGEGNDGGWEDESDGEGNGSEESGGEEDGDQSIHAAEGSGTDVDMRD